MKQKSLICIAIALLVVLFPSYSQSEVEYLMRESLSAYRSQNYSQAVTLCTKINQLIAANNTTLKLENYVTWRLALTASKNHQQALDIALRAEEIAPFDYRILFALAESYYFLGRDSKAMPYLQQYIAINPTGDAVGRIYYYMGELYFRHGLYNHADIALSTAVYHMPRAVDWWFRLGYIREINKNYIQAKQAYDRVLALNPSHTEARQRQPSVIANLK